jgi:hypothetical protein
VAKLRIQLLGSELLAAKIVRNHVICNDFKETLLTARGQLGVDPRVLRGNYLFQLIRYP